MFYLLYFLPWVAGYLIVLLVAVFVVHTIRS